MNLKTSLWFFTLMMTLTFFSCEKDPFEDCRKDPTCEYFTCKVNGERWEPQCEGEPFFGCTPWDVQYSKNIPSLDLSAKNEKRSQNILMIVHKTILKEGENKLYSDINIQTFFADGKFSNGCKIFNIDTLTSSTLNISKIDTVDYFLSGTFHFTAKNDCGDVMTITDGEFNLPYRF
jgi:hypothetical protein